MSSWYPTRDSLFLGNFVKRQAELLSHHYQVTVLFTKSDETIKEFDICDQQNGSFREVIVYHPKGKNLFQKLLFQKRALRAGMKRIENVSLVHGHVMLPRGIQFIIAKKHFNCPLLVTEHGSYFRNEVKEKRTFLDRYILKDMNRNIDKLTVVSEFLKQDVQKDFPDKTISILPNHVDTAVFIPKQKEKKQRKEFLHVSTLDEKLKNPKGIIQACELLLIGGITDFHLTIVSDEPVQKWVHFAEEKKLSGYITFVGQTEWFDLVPFYQNSDAFILFSSYETFSIVLAEAWSCGIPTLTTPVGIGHSLPSEMGIQIEITSEESLANAMIEIIQEKKHFNTTVIRSHAELFSGEKIISIFEDLLTSVFGTRS